MRKFKCMVYFLFKMIIGITGTLGAGKGTIVKFLEEKRFNHYSVRGFLTKIIKEEGNDVHRDNMIELANRLRTEHGPSYIIEELYKEAIVYGGDVVIESIRAVGEVHALQKKGNFYLFAVDAEPKLRYERIKLRKSSTDMVSYGEFLEQERKEMQNENPNKQNLAKCISMADYVFDNNGTEKELEKRVVEVLNGIRS